MQFSDLLVPISAEEPCGTNLEYDPEYTVLFAKIANRADVQYGDFIEGPEPINWSEVERECKRLLLRTKDIALLVLLIRSRTCLAGASGFYEGMDLLWKLIKTYPDQINPPLIIEGELDIAVRANALAMLIDSDGLLGDLRQVVLSKGAGLRLQVRDVERAFAIPKHADSLAPESVISQLQQMIYDDNAEIQAIIKVLPIVTELLNWASENLKEFTPNFSPLRDLLTLFEHPELQSVYQTASEYDESSLVAHESELLSNEEENQSSEVLDHLADQEEPKLSTFSDNVNMAEESSVEQMSMNETKAKTIKAAFIQDSRLGRKQALDSIRQARIWFEQFEPSSPVIVLLKQAERMVGKRFIDLVQIIPLELLSTWDGGEHNEEQNPD